MSEEYYEATVEVETNKLVFAQNNFTYTVKIPEPSTTNLGNISFEEYVWLTVLITLNNSYDMSDRYAKRETLTVDLVRVTTTREKVL